MKFDENLILHDGTFLNIQKYTIIVNIDNNIYPERINTKTMHKIIAFPKFLNKLKEF